MNKKKWALMVSGLILILVSSYLILSGTLHSKRDSSEVGNLDNNADSSEVKDLDNNTDNNGTMNLISEDESDAIAVPILTYHHIDEDESKGGSVIVTPEKFQADMEALKAEGYHTIFFKDLVKYVEEGVSLPDKPIVITFDDGYLSNYEYAYPILKELEMKATISVIGISVGKTTYKDTEYEIIPHFSYEQAKEMYLSGVIDIQSHTYNLHDSEAYEVDYRMGVQIKSDETEAEYVEIFKNDYILSKDNIENYVGNEVFVFTYPLGEYNEISESLLIELDNKVSLTTQLGTNMVIKGDPSSLLLMNRLNVPNNMTASELIDLLQSYAN
jgi:peptidoglycan/xylan/chitin deacetylase (PgdA/CDA1 family)